MLDKLDQPVLRQSVNDPTTLPTTKTCESMSLSLARTIRLTGRALAVFGRWRYQGKLHLIVILPNGSRSLMPTEWTDFDSCALCSPAESTQNTNLGSVKDLLRARCRRRSPQPPLHIGGEAAKNLSARRAHIAAQSELSRHPHSGNPSVGNAGERAQNGGERSSGATDRQGNTGRSKTAGRP